MKVGIESMAVYIPPSYVLQQDLEKYDGCEGKYTRSLMMSSIAVPFENETAADLAENAILDLMTKNNLKPADIGRIEVATESMDDKSKSIKSYLMKHFSHENQQIEGVDVYHACYGGTSAIFSAIEWICGPFWNGKKAIVVTTDIAELEFNYKFLNGASAVAILISEQGKICFTSMRTTSCTNEYDFYKPIKEKYPVFDGPKSLECYLVKLQYCLQNSSLEEIASSSRWVFHCTSGIVCKKASECVAKFLKVPDSEIKNTFEQKVKPSMDWLSKIGTMYTSAVYTNLACLLYHQGQQLAANNSSILVFSYGSGAMGTLYKVECREDISDKIFPPWVGQERKNISIETWIKNQMRAPL